MTGQTMEVILIKGKREYMASLPLNKYFSLAGINPPLRDIDTSLWRRYLGTWEIDDGRLYLTNLEGSLEDKSVFSITSIFPFYKDRVFAFWYTGLLDVAQGKFLVGSDRGFNHISEGILHIKIESGLVVNETYEDTSNNARGLIWD